MRWVPITILFLVGGPGLVPAGAQVRMPRFADLWAVFPAGGQRGQTVEVTLRGRDLHAPSRVLVEGGGIEVRSVRAANERELRAELAIRADAAPGPRALRVTGERGVSDPAWFTVGTLPEAVETEPNATPAAASKVLEPPLVINGRLGENLDVDCYRFRARKGEPLALAVSAYTLDAQTEDPGGRFLDTVLKVFDGSGRVLAAAQDHTTLDPALVFEPPADGDYCVEIRDVGYRGHARAVYRLTIAAAPYPLSVYPAGGRRGTRAVIQVEGLNVPPGATGEVAIPMDAAPGARACGAIGAVPRWITALPEAGAAVPFVVGDLPEALEREPNDTPSEATPIECPVTVNGRLGRPGDEDQFALSLRKGEGIVLDVLAGRTLRSPVDLEVFVTDAAGRQLAHNDDSPFTMEATHNRRDSLSGDPRLEFVAREDGRFVVGIRDVAGRGGPHCVYRMTVARREPGFGLTTWYDNPSIKGPGGTGVVLVMPQRWGGFSGPIRARVAGLPAGYTASETVIPPSVTAVLLTLTAPPDAPVGSVVPFRIEGEAEIEGRRLTATAEPRAHLGQNADHSIFRASESCLACVVPADEFRVRAETRTVSGKPGETVRVPVTVMRERGFTGEISLVALRGLPMTFGAPVRVPAGAERFDFPLPIPADLAPGEYPFVICRPMYGDYRSDRPHTSTPLLTLVVQGDR